MIIIILISVLNNLLPPMSLTVLVSCPLTDLFLFVLFRESLVFLLMFLKGNGKQIKDIKKKETKRETKMPLCILA